MSAHVEPHRFEAATGDDRLSMVAHLRDCPSCQIAAMAHDPSILFALLAVAPIPRRVLDDVSVEVSRRAGSDRGSIGGVIASMPSARLRVAVAAVAVLALFSGHQILRNRPAGQISAIAATEPRPLLPQRADVEVLPASAVSQVVDFTVGETQVVMVYNGDLEL